MDRLRQSRALAPLILVTSVFLSGSAIGQPKKPLPFKKDSAGTAWIYVDALAGATEWKARAFSSAVEFNLSRFNRIQVKEMPPLKDLGCHIDNLNCILKAARDFSIDIVVTGNLGPTKIKLTSYETWTHYVVATETLALGDNSNLEDLRHRTFRLIKPFTQIGGLLDQHSEISDPHYLPAARTDSPATEDGPPISIALLVLLTAILIFLFWLPRFTVHLIAGATGGEFVPTPRLATLNVVNSVLFPVGAAATVLFTVSFGQIATGDFFSTSRYFISGTLWAYSFMLLKRSLVPKVHAMEEVNYVSIFPVLRAWFLVVIGRLPALITTAGPVVLGALIFAQNQELDSNTIRLIMIPLGIVVGCTWYTMWIEHVALLQGKFTPPDDSKSKRPWRGVIRKYFLRYLDRRSIDVSDRVYAGKRLWRFPIVRAVAVTVFVVIFWIRAKEAVRYHAVYTARMAELQQKILFEQHKLQERGNGPN